MARLTYLGAPESLQGAVAAGLCGLGSVFVGSMEGSAKMLPEAMPDPAAAPDLDAVAAAIVAQFAESKAIVPGIGHPFHKPISGVCARAKASNSSNVRPAVLTSLPAYTAKPGLA